MPRHGVRPAIAALHAALLAACGGGGDGGNATPVAAPAPAVAGALNDNTAYSSPAGASLSTSSELAATSSRTLALAGTNATYSASAGHLDARDPLNGATKTSMFYVAYTVAGAAASRPLVFFFNGGPGSAVLADLMLAAGMRLDGVILLSSALDYNTRVRPSASSPHGAALAARVQAKIAERDRDVYR